VNTSMTVKAPDSPAAAMRRLERAIELLTTASPPESVVRARAETLLGLLSNLSIPILIADNRGRYVDVNHAATRLTGYSRAELLRMAIWDLTPRPGRTAGARLWRAFLKRGRMSGDYHLCRKDETLLTARYFAVANVLPGVHVAALIADAGATRRRKRASRQGKQR
jgi:PAS domain S-box-containing protein